MGCDVVIKHPEDGTIEVIRGMEGMQPV